MTRPTMTLEQRFRLDRVTTGESKTFQKQVDQAATIVAGADGRPEMNSVEFEALLAILPSWAGDNSGRNDKSLVSSAKDVARRLAPSFGALDNVTALLKHATQSRPVEHFQEVIGLAEAMKAVDAGAMEMPDNLPGKLQAGLRKYAKSLAATKDAVHKINGRDAYDYSIALDYLFNKMPDDLGITLPWVRAYNNIDGFEKPTTKLMFKVCKEAPGGYGGN